MMNGYIGFYNGQKHEFYAESQYAAYQQAVAHFKPPRRRAHMVHVHLAERNVVNGKGEQVYHQADF